MTLSVRPLVSLSVTIFQTQLKGGEGGSRMVKDGQGWLRIVKEG